MKKLFAITIALLALIFTGCDNDDYPLVSRPFVHFSLEIYDSNGLNLLDPEVEGNLIGSQIRYKFEGQVLPYFVKWERLNGTEIVHEDTGQMNFDKDFNRIDITSGNIGADKEFTFKITIMARDYNVNIKYFTYTNKTREYAMAYINDVPTDIDSYEVTLTNNFTYTASYTLRLTIPAEE